MNAPGASHLPVADHRTVERLEHELLARLGLDERATPEEIDAAYADVSAYLAAAPRSMRSWVHIQAAAADEAYALLTDPAALERSAALAGRASRSTIDPGGPATPPARRDTPSTTQGSGARPSGVPQAPSPAAAVAETRRKSSNGAKGTPVKLSDDELEDLFVSVTPSAHRDQAGPRRAARSKAVVSAESEAAQARVIALPRLPLRRLAVIGVIAIAGIAVAVGGYGLGGASSAGAAPAASTDPSAAFQAQVGPLMQKLQANPNDFETLMALGDAFFQNQQFDVAADWFKKAVAVDPKNVRALLALGAAAFNGGQLDEAESSWKQVLAIEPDNVEAHYDLGFLYLNQDPPDMDGVKREWNRVVELAPDSAIAKTVQSHLKALASPGPSGASPSGSPVGSPGASPVASPSPSSVPTATPPATPGSGGGQP